jgi:hypothetical protein
VEFPDNSKEFQGAQSFWAKYLPPLQFHNPTVGVSVVRLDKSESNGILKIALGTYLSRTYATMILLVSRVHRDYSLPPKRSHETAALSVTMEEN